MIWAARAERYASADPCEVVPFWPNADGLSIVAELFFRIVAGPGTSFSDESMMRIIV